jgi:hypothetical protein
VLRSVRETVCVRSVGETVWVRSVRVTVCAASGMNLKLLFRRRESFFFSQLSVAALGSRV